VCKTIIREDKYMSHIKFSEFYKYQELERFLFEAEKSYSQYIKLKNLVVTPEGRNVYLAEITNPETGTAENKGAYFIQAGVHAQEAAGTTAALYLIKQLLEDEKYKDLLKKIAFYIIPRVNPDGTEYALTKRCPIRSRLREAYGKNRIIPKDLNNDGYILTMRWKDPAGPLKEDEEDPRILVRRQPGDEGPFYNVLMEGIIEDFDGARNINNGSDTLVDIKNIKLPSYIDFNRNWPVNWNPKMPGASSYPFSEPEMKIVGDFLINHPNIFAGIDLHCGCNGILRPSMKPDSEMNQEDLGLILNIGKIAEKITGFPQIHEREYKEPWKQPLMLHGNSNDWSYFKMGISHYVVELGNGFNCAGISTKEYFNADSITRETVFMRKVLKYHDDNKSKIFVPWEKYQHPQLGTVEIGGILEGNAYYMYPPVMEKISPKVAEFMVYHAENHPELIISSVEVIDIGINNQNNTKTCRIRTTVGNIGGFGTKIMNGGGSPDTHFPVTVKLALPERAEILSQIKIFEINNLGALGDSETVEWFVKLPTNAVDKEQNILFIETRHPRAGICRMKQYY
jgi:hypothetical protein